MKILIFRNGAFGDSLVITPLLRSLHALGHELYVQTGKRGMEVLKNNPHVHRLIQHKEDTPIDKLSENIEWVRKKFGCDKVIDLSESIEVSLSQHPRSPNYKLPKRERFLRYNRNFYEYTFECAGFEWNSNSLRPELFFDTLELSNARKHLTPDFNVLIGMSGSGTNKTWPWTESFCFKVCDEFPKVHFITVGEERCHLIEPIREGRITNLSGKISMREAMCLTGLVDLVIAPDTGIMHAAGCYDTPKICLLGHNTKECITKYFENDYSIESDSTRAPCSPCLFLVYDKNLQCPTVEECGGASLCMAHGIPMETVYERFKEVYVKSQERS